MMALAVPVKATCSVPDRNQSKFSCNNKMKKKSYVVKEFLLGVSRVYTKLWIRANKNTGNLTLKSRAINKVTLCQVTSYRMCCASRIIGDSKSCLSSLNWSRSVSFWHFLVGGGDIRHWLEMTSFWFVMVS